MSDLDERQARMGVDLGRELLGCPTCGGKGWVYMAAGYVGGVPGVRQERCRDCKGTGEDIHPEETQR